MEMQCTIFELDQDRFTRDQGGIADRHREMGQLALREAGLWVKNDGRVFWDENDANDAGTGHSGERPEIDRARLRDIFLDSIQSDSIQWNKKLIRVESAEAPDTEYNLRFADGVKVGFDLVVGADGTWSRVRTLLTDQLPFYSGISVIELKAMEVSAKKWWLSNLTGQGSCFMFDEVRALVCQRNGNDSIRVYAAVRQPETWVKERGIDWDQRDLAQKIFTERCFGDCHDDLKRIIAVEDLRRAYSETTMDAACWFEMFTTPWCNSPWGCCTSHDPIRGCRSERSTGDALDLSRVLLKRKVNFEADLPDNLADALQEYEGPMFERARENMEKTWGGLQHHFSANGVDDRVRRLQGRAKQREAAKLGEEAELREKAKRWEQGTLPSLSLQQRV